ncbi:MAG: hypothetical protein V1809_01975 [Planctomycetota bacterium]
MDVNVFSREGKLYAQAGHDAPRRITTRLPDHVELFSPIVQKTESGWTITFLARLHPGDVPFLCRASAATLDGEFRPMFLFRSETNPPERKPCGCGGGVSAAKPIPVRPSCMECVEKHLGAAYVLLAEVNDGYAHRLRAVGHLHEAEDESQEWPELHQAIRAARRGYQAEGRMPDWDALEKLIVRGGCASPLTPPLHPALSPMR